MLLFWSKNNRKLIGRTKVAKQKEGQKWRGEKKKTYIYIYKGQTHVKSNSLMTKSPISPQKDFWGKKKKGIIVYCPTMPEVITDCNHVDWKFPLLFCHLKIVILVTASQFIQFKVAAAATITTIIIKKKKTDKNGITYVQLVQENVSKINSNYNI